MENNPIRALIVEDEALIAEDIRNSLESFGYGIAGICYDFESAAKALVQTDADIVLLDINLGGGEGRGGLELAELLNEKNPRPFLFLTAYSDADTVGRAALTRPASYLVKPVNPHTLFATIQVSIARLHDPHLVPERLREQPAFFYTKLGSRRVKVYWQDVMYMISGKNYVRMFPKSGNGIPATSIPVRGTLNTVLDQLIPESLRNRFFRLGRGQCLNKIHVTDFSEHQIVCGGQAFENRGRIAEEEFQKWLNEGLLRGSWM